jgi:hypothetical protein
MLDMRVVRPVVLVSALIAWHAAMSASAVYQWEDEKGQVHFSDTVPDKYKRAARRIDTGRADIAPEQVRAAQAQADALKARAAGAPSSSPPASSRQLRASTLPSAAAVGRPPANLDDCAAWRSAFLASRDCYAGYQTNRGPLKAGAYEACGPEIANPEPRCGPEK